MEDEDQDEDEDKEERVFLGKLTQWTSRPSGGGSQLTILNGGRDLSLAGQPGPHDLASQHLGSLG